MSETTTAPGADGARRRAPRPAALRLIGIWLAVLSVLAGAGTATATAGEGSARHGRHVTLAGTWDLSVTVHSPDGDSVTDSRFVFLPDHQLTVVGPVDGDGEPQFAGGGFWSDRSDGTFTFYVTHPPGPPGAPYPGKVEAVHLGRISGKHFTSSAHAFVTVEENGHPQGPIGVDATATRVRTAR
ncbi:MULTISPECIES: hypothetical protein [unclassified Streptomyces]|uniref:hypothetical protein n=1 Tax=unclassified Streptomyces TaxID=2593676 RepID=UPI0033B301D5